MTSPVRGPHLVDATTVVHSALSILTDDARIQTSEHQELSLVLVAYLRRYCQSDVVALLAAEFVVDTFVALVAAETIVSAGVVAGTVAVAVQVGSGEVVVVDTIDRVAVAPAGSGKSHALVADTTRVPFVVYVAHTAVGFVPAAGGLVLICIDRRGSLVGPLPRLERSVLSVKLEPVLCDLGLLHRDFQSTKPDLPVEQNSLRLPTMQPPRHSSG